MGETNNGTNIPAHCWAAWRYAKPGMGRGYIPPPGATALPVAHAFVNAGRWMTQCPFGCGSAQVISETDRFWYCVTCANYSANGHSIPIMWPAADFCIALEDLLIERPAIFQNWVPGETLEQIQAENIARGPVS